MFSVFFFAFFEVFFFASFNVSFLFFIYIFLFSLFLLSAETQNSFLSKSVLGSKKCSQGSVHRIVFFTSYKFFETPFIGFTRFCLWEKAKVTFDRVKWGHLWHRTVYKWRATPSIPMNKTCF
jgi:hypothetical protein